MTLFAPNDRAFIRLANDLGYEGSDEAGAFDAIVQTLTLLGNGDPLPLLTSVLTYHVVDETLFFGELRQLSSVNTVFGENIVPRYNRIVRRRSITTADQCFTLPCHANDHVTNTGGRW